MTIIRSLAFAAFAGLPLWLASMALIREWTRGKHWLRRWQKTGD